MSATAPKEMWFQTCTAPTGGKCSSRQISSLNDLSAEEQQQLRESGNILTISNPGIFNNREDALKNAAKQNISETNQKGILVVMNPPTGQYDSWWILSSLPSELMYAAYDKLNDVSGGRFLPLSNAEKLNQDLYLQAQEQGYMVDTSNHSRGGLTASVSLKNLNNVYDIKDLPIRKSRFYGTATNVQDYADQLRANGYSYTDANGNNYQIDLSNHSRGGMTASVALQYANRNGLTEVPIRESRFYGTATNVQDYANQLAEKNRYTYIGSDGKTYGSDTYSAVHHTDFIGRSPLLLLRSKYTVGGNEPTGGVENKWFLYSHSSYFREIPSEYLKDRYGNYFDEKGNKSNVPIDNPYFDEFIKKWKDGENHNINIDNPSIPNLINPK